MLGETAQKTVTVVHSAMAIQMVVHGWQSNALGESYTLVQMDSSFDHDLPNSKIAHQENVGDRYSIYAACKARTATVSVRMSI